MHIDVEKQMFGKEEKVYWVTQRQRTQRGLAHMGPC